MKIMFKCPNCGDFVVRTVVRRKDGHWWFRLGAIRPYYYYYRFTSCKKPTGGSRPTGR